MLSAPGSVRDSSINRGPGTTTSDCRSGIQMRGSVIRTALKHLSPIARPLEPQGSAADMTDWSHLATPGKLDALKWRCIGPSRGGRVVAVAGDPVDPMVFYFGACAGGIWKTIDGGVYWRCISDGFLDSAAIGAIAVSPSDHNVVFAGTGETEIRLDVSYGDGIYKSMDAGRSWSHAGLGET